MSAAPGEVSSRPPLLAGSRAIVTGAWGGIGSGIVHGLRAEGASIAGIGRNAPDATRKGDLGLEAVIIADLSEREETDRAVREAVTALGGLDVLVTAHGHVRPQSSVDVDVDDWNLTLATNLSSCFQLSQLAFAEMHRGGRGKIVHIVSMYAFLGGLRVAAYAASKGALGQLVKSLALEWAPLGINVNAIAPGYVRTKMNQHIWDDPERAELVIGRIPAGRWGEPEDLAGPTLFLCSPMSDYVHGVILPVDGGYLAR